MIFQYGSYAHPDHECLVAFFGESRRYNPRGRAQTKVRRMQVEGMIIAAGAAAIDARVAEIKNAYALEGGAALLKRSNGAATQYSLPSSADSFGTRVLDLSFRQQEGRAHYATGLPFSLTLEAEYLVSDGDPLVTYSESISTIGNGGPRRVVVELDNGPPVEQIVSSRTPIVVVQSGEAVGSVDWLAPNAPLFPGLVDQPDGHHVSRTAPRINGLRRADYGTRWTYRHTLTSFPGDLRPLIR